MPCCLSQSLSKRTEKTPKLLSSRTAGARCLHCLSSPQNCEFHLNPILQLQHKPSSAGPAGALAAPCGAVRADQHSTLSFPAAASHRQPAEVSLLGNLGLLFCSSPPSKRRGPAPEPRVSLAVSIPTTATEPAGLPLPTHIPQGLWPPRSGPAQMGFVFLLIRPKPQILKGKHAWTSGAEHSLQTVSRRAGPGDPRRSPL